MSKKIIAGAGVLAGLAVALAPVATFATPRSVSSDTHTDTLKIEVPTSCAFGSANSSPAAIVGVEHPTNGTDTSDFDGTTTATWTAGTGANANTNTGLTPDRDGNGTTRHDSADEMTNAFKIYTGTEKHNVAQTKLTVYCNNTAQSYKLEAQLNPLEITGWDGSTITDTIDPNASYSATASGYAIYTITPTSGNVGQVASSYDASDGTERFAATSSTVIAQSPTSGTAKIAADGDSYTMQYGVGVDTAQKAGIYTGTVVYNLYQVVE